MNETFTPDTQPNIADKPADTGAEPLPSDLGHTPELKLVPDDAPESGINTSVHTSHPTVDISRHLKAPRLSNVKPNTVSYDQAHKGININIPGAAQMRFGDTLVFHWGQNESSTQLLLRNITRESTVRVLCISYELITHAHYGVVDVFYEVHRDHQLIGTSPVVKVTVNGEPSPPAAPRQTQKGPHNSEQNAA